MSHKIVIVIRQQIIHEKHNTVFSPVWFLGVSLFSSCVSRIGRASRSLDWTERWVRSSCKACHGEFVRKVIPRVRLKSRGRQFN